MIKEAECLVCLQSTFHQEPDRLTHVQSILSTYLEDFVPLASQDSSDFVPEDKSLYICYDAIVSLSKLEPVESILHIIVLVEVLVIVSQVEELENELAARLHEILLEQE